MRRESLFFGILTLVVSAFLTGCSDDDTEVYVPQRVAEFNLSDESDGNRLFIIHPWEGEIPSRCTMIVSATSSSAASISIGR